MRANIAVHEACKFQSIYLVFNNKTILSLFLRLCNILFHSLILLKKNCYVDHTICNDPESHSCFTTI